MRKLIYFTISNNPEYINLLKICLESLYYQKYDGDVLFITNLQELLLNSLEFEKKPLFLTIETSGLLESSANKLKIYKYPNLKDYDKIIFCDADIVWTSSPDNIFNNINEDFFYVSNENSLMSEEWWGGKILTTEEKLIIEKKQIKGINAGIFGFNSKLVNHLEKIETFLLQNKQLVNICLEQPFFNVYLFRNNLYKTDLSNMVSHNGYNLKEYNGSALHFAGGPGNYSNKFSKMKEFKYKN
jgi:hypothetical protein